MRNPHAEDISWQDQIQRKGLVELPVDEEIVGSFLECLKSIETGKGETSKGERTSCLMKKSE